MPPRIPSRKEPKETVVYAASKSKVAPFKPHRPSQAPRVSNTESEGGSFTTKETSVRPGPAKRKRLLQDEDRANARGGRAGHDDEESENSDSSEELADNPITARPRPRAPALSKPQLAKQKPRPRQPSPMSVSDDNLDNDDESNDLPLPSGDRIAKNDALPQPSQSDIPPIPQPLLIRLLHEHFADKSTQIDKQAIQVLQTYVEVFVRETIARAAMQKKSDAAEAGGGGGRVSEMDLGWLEKDDLERVAAGMMLDF